MWVRNVPKPCSRRYPEYMGCDAATGAGETRHSQSPRGRGHAASHNESRCRIQTERGWGPSVVSVRVAHPSPLTGRGQWPRNTPLPPSCNGGRQGMPDRCGGDEDMGGCRKSNPRSSGVGTYSIESVTISTSTRHTLVRHNEEVSPMYLSRFIEQTFTLLVHLNSYHTRQPIELDCACVLCIFSNKTSGDFHLHHTPPTREANGYLRWRRLRDN